MHLEATRQKLIKEMATLTARKGVIEAHLRNADRELPDDWSERATFVENDEVLEALDDHGRRRLAALNAALERMDKGTWGVCRTCEEDINPRRMKALPEADMCVECASD